MHQSVLPKEVLAKWRAQGTFFLFAQGTVGKMTINFRSIEKIIRSIVKYIEKCVPLKLRGEIFISAE